MASNKYKKRRIGFVILLLLLLLIAVGVITFPLRRAAVPPPSPKS